ILQQSDRLALLSRHQIRHELLVGSLTVLDFPLSQVPRMVGMTTRRDWYPTSLQGEYLEAVRRVVRSEEHTSELQSREKLVCSHLCLTHSPYPTLFRSHSPAI